MMRKGNFRCSKCSGGNIPHARAGGVYLPWNTWNTLSIYKNIYLKERLNRSKCRSKVNQSVPTPASRFSQSSEIALRTGACVFQSRAVPGIAAYGNRRLGALPPSPAGRLPRSISAKVKTRRFLLGGNTQSRHPDAVPVLPFRPGSATGAGCTRPAPGFATADRAGGNSGRRLHTSKARVIPSPCASAIKGSFRARRVGLFGGSVGVRLSKIRQLVESVMVFVETARHAPASPAFPAICRQKRRWRAGNRLSAPHPHENRLTPLSGPLRRAVAVLTAWGAPKRAEEVWK